MRPRNRYSRHKDTWFVNYCVPLQSYDLSDPLKVTKEDKKSVGIRKRNRVLFRLYIINL